MKGVYTGEPAEVCETPEETCEVAPSLGEKIAH